MANHKACRARENKNARARHTNTQNRTDADRNHREVAISATTACRPRSPQTDHTQLDMKLVASDGKVLKPWVIVEVDAYSGLVLRTQLIAKDLYAG
jgi:hypothetical protein